MKVSGVRSPADAPLIRLKGVERTFPSPTGAFRALKGITLSIPQGGMTALTGRSGSGKSTLLNMISGIDRPTAGTVRVAGAAVEALSERELAAWRGSTVGVVFQFFQLIPSLTVAENVMLPMDFCGTGTRRQRREAALSFLHQVGIADQAQKFPQSLSGGQQQRAAIARALANDPPLIVADEPTGNLDSRTAEGIFALFADLAGRGKTVVVVTHEKDAARHFGAFVTLADGNVTATEGLGEAQ